MKEIRSSHTISTCLQHVCHQHCFSSRTLFYLSTRSTPLAPTQRCGFGNSLLSPAPIHCISNGSLALAIFKQPSFDPILPYTYHPIFRFPFPVRLLKYTVYVRCILHSHINPHWLSLPLCLQNPYY